MMVRVTRHWGDRAPELMSLSTFCSLPPGELRQCIAEVVSDADAREERDFGDLQRVKVRSSAPGR